MVKGADYNFLITFRELTGFMIAEKTEAIDIAALKRFPKHRAPPFIYLTGSQNISLSQSEIKILRWYLLEEGGMIFADNGGGSFNNAFRSVMKCVLPQKPWIDIANDDIIYRQPYGYTQGAPPLWHQVEGNRDLEIATCPANHPETPQPLQSRFLNRGSFPKLAHFPRAFSTHGLGL